MNSLNSCYFLFTINNRQRDSLWSNWNQKVPSKKGGVSDILKGFVRNFDQVISSQEVREQLIEDGELEQALMTLKDGMPSGFFSKEKQFSAENLGKTFSKLNESQKETYLANIPYFIELVTAGESVNSASDIESEISSITNDINGPYWNKSHPDHDKVVQQVYTLREMLNDGK